jgi:hypothetical protein
MEWDKRIYDSIGKESKIKHLENTDYFVQELWRDILDYHNRSRKQKMKIDWTEVKDLTDTEKIQNLTNIQKMYDTTLRTLTSEPMSITEMQMMIQLFKTQEQEQSLNEDEINDSILNQQDMDNRLHLLQQLIDGED